MTLRRLLTVSIAAGGLGAAAALAADRALPAPGDDDPAPSGRDRHGRDHAALRTRRAAASVGPGHHRRAGPGDRGDAPGARHAAASAAARRATPQKFIREGTLT